MNHSNAFWTKETCRLSSASAHQDEERLQSPVRQILSLSNRLTEQLKKEAGESCPTTDSLQERFNWTKVQRSLHSQSMQEKSSLIKTKNSTELPTFPTGYLNFILTAKEIKCHMPPDFLLQTSCAMLQKPQ